MDLLFLVSEDDGVTTSVDQVNFYREYYHLLKINKKLRYFIIYISQFIHFHTKVHFAEELLKEAGKTNYQICIYEGMGHIVDLPYLPPVHITNHAYFPKPIEVLMGGDDKLAHTRGQIQLWNDTLNFLRRPSTLSSNL